MGKFMHCSLTASPSPAARCQVFLESKNLPMRGEIFATPKYMPSSRKPAGVSFPSVRFILSQLNAPGSGNRDAWPPGCAAPQTPAPAQREGVQGLGLVSGL